MPLEDALICLEGIKAGLKHALIPFLYLVIPFTHTAPHNFIALAAIFSLKALNLGIEALNFDNRDLNLHIKALNLYVKALNLRSVIPVNKVKALTNNTGRRFERDLKIVSDIN